MSTISTKQDRTYARTVQDIERKYAFGKSFADTLGLINDNRDKVDSVESQLQDEIEDLETTLKRDAQQIVAEAKRELKTSIDSVAEDVTELSSEVELKLDADGVAIAIEKEMAKGVERVTTTTGYVFDSAGLNISKTGDEIKNLLDNTGVYVKKSGDNVLVANKDGVEATDLHAKTYLIIGAGEGRSRFEDYGIDETGCFWVGG